ncbi:MAG: hypothetical protein OXG16_08050 [Rhodospirillales bacterium]|nr:hypothetical protein [Rhodospirillales bacterium]
MEAWIDHPVVWIAGASTLFGIGVWVGSVNHSLSDFKTFLPEIRNKLDLLLQRLPLQTLATGSPLQLTELGKQISVELGAAEIAARAVPGLLRHAEGKSAYQIQELSFAYFRETYQPDPEMDRRIQDCAFENGINVGQIQEVFAVLLRDELLKQSAASNE